MTWKFDGVIKQPALGEESYLLLFVTKYQTIQPNHKHTQGFIRLRQPSIRLKFDFL